MPIVTPSLALEKWLTNAADTWEPIADPAYRELLVKWQAAFGADLGRGAGIQGPGALQEFEALLPAAVVLFNGVTVARAATSAARHPHAYRAARLRRLDRALANELDLVLVSKDFSFCCICTHEWQALAHPIFVQRAA
jgi:hypothetical protein